MRQETGKHVTRSPSTLLVERDPAFRCNVTPVVSAIAIREASMLRAEGAQAVFEPSGSGRVLAVRAWVTRGRPTISEWLLYETIYQGFCNDAGLDVE
mmetsp:Transcript_17390/g.34734  ORF Transcript_17390/g.34734 Transcript_17390/m.34734 type:complete len:97 (+) Transcript_17390:4750-5040(+)